MAEGSVRSIGRYTLISELGKGGCAVVYRAVAPSGREVALKVVRDDRGDDEATLERFKLEVKIAFSLDHPNIVQTYDAGVEGEQIFLALEYLPGGSLADLLAREKRLFERRAVSVSRDVFRALAAIGDAGLIHRDLKPQNVLLDETGLAKVTDLGLARTTSVTRTRYTNTGFLVGSPLYMSPEQLDDAEDLDLRSDLYSAGVVLFECLTGERPFTGQSVSAVIRKQLSEQAPDVRTKAPEVSTELSRLVASLLEKDRDKRPANARAVIQALGVVLPAATTRIAARTHGRIEVPWHPTNATASAPSEPAAGPGLARAALVALVPNGAPTFFVYGGEWLEFGRGVTDDRDARYVCLRLRPEAGNEALNQRISRNHFALMVRDGTPCVSDVGSAGGTLLSGKQLRPGEVVSLERFRELMTVANVLDLVVRRVDCEANHPSIVVERPANGTEHSYAVVPRRLALEADRGRLVAGATGSVEIMWRDQALWARERTSTERRLEPGVVLRVGELDVHVRAIRSNAAIP
jgi:hypothetical protein